MALDSCGNWFLYAFIALVLYPILVPVFLLCFILNQAVGYCTRCCGIRNGRALHFNDELWVTLNNPESNIINALLFLQGRVEQAALADQIQRRWLDVRRKDGRRRFLQFASTIRSRCGRKYWVEEDDLNLSQRISVKEIASPQLQEEIDRLGSTAMDMTKPLWHLYIFHFTDKEETGLFFRIHHSLGDGLALVRLLVEQLVDEESSEKAVSSVITTGSSRGTRSSRRLCSRPCCMTCKTITITPAFLFYRMFYPRDKGLWHGPKLTYQRSLAYGPPLDLKEVKEVKTKLGVSINDLLLGILSTAFQRAYSRQLGGGLQKSISVQIAPDVATAVGESGTEASREGGAPPVVSTGEDQEREEKSSAVSRNPESPSAGPQAGTGAQLTTEMVHYPKKNIQVTMPVNVRPVTSTTDMTNMFATAFVNLPLKLRKEAEEHALSIKRQTDAMKNSGVVPAAFFAQAVTVAAFPKFQARSSLKMLGDKATAVVTNVPGPQVGIKLCKHDVERIMFWAPGVGNIGVIVSLFSYNGMVEMTVQGDTKVMKHPELLTEAFRQVWEEVRGRQLKTRVGEVVGEEANE